MNAQQLIDEVRRVCETYHPDVPLTELPVKVLMWNGMQAHDVNDVSTGSGMTLNVNILGTSWKDA